MVKNFFTIAWRNIKRNKGFSVINIGGLALGMTCSMLIFLWVYDEMNVDGFNGDRGIYTVYERMFSDGKVDAGPWAPGVLANELKLQIPEIKYATGFWHNSQETLFEVGEKRLTLKGAAADSDFFKIFNYTLLEGTAASALRSPDDIAISEKMAVAFFGTVDKAIGNMIRMDNRKDFKVTAVFENVPDNASEQFDFVSNWTDLLETVTWLKSWIYRGPYTYLQLLPGADATAVGEKIKNFLTPHLTDTGVGFRTELGLQRYDQMYLHSNFVDGYPQGGRIEYVQLFSLIAVFILLIACINFMNLATARAVKRAKEVGIRKTVGAARIVLVIQHLGEALWISFLAGVLALTAIAAVLPAFNILTGKHIALPFSSPGFWIAFVTLQVVTGFIAGSYPAFFLSALNPVQILKGSLKVSPNALLFRKALVVFQFVIAIAMTTCTVIISRQVSFIQSRNLGYDKDNLIYIPMQSNLITKYDVFRQQLLRSRGIEGVTRSTNAPAHINTHEYDFEWEGKPEDQKVVAIHNGIGYDFLKMMNIPVIDGRNFSREFPSDSNAFIINETALKITGYKDPIGKPLHFLQRSGTIVGVVADFHLTSLREPIKPLVLFLGEEATWGFTLVKVQSGQMQQAIAALKEAHDQLTPEFPLNYFFADEEYQKLYNSEQTVSKLSDLFSLFAIFISCLGLLGLTLFTVEQRRKEIGVRKVIGATTIDILGMLSKSIVQLLLIAAIIAAPISWLAMDKWLQNFAVRTPLSVWLFLFATAATLGIALLIIGYQAIKASLANPVKSLRVE
jgi:putative ABC transport system permease protein